MSPITFDVHRMSAALERAGIDPRTWTTLAIVTAVNVSRSGVHVAFTTIMGLEETAELAPIYAGPGFGLYTPIAVDDMVLVAFPEGIANTGARVIATTWDGGSRPPQDVVDHPDDFILVVKEDSSLRIVTSGSGSVIFEARGTGKVKLDGPDADDPVVRKSDLAAVVARLEGHDHPYTNVTTPSVTGTTKPAVPPFTTPACSPKVVAT